MSKRESEGRDFHPAKIEPYQAFPVGALPQPVRDFVVAGARAIGCDESYVALPLLSALGAAIGNSRRIHLKRTWDEPAIVWTAIVGESGTAKSPAMELALRPVRKAQNKAMREYAAAVEAHERAMADYERAMTAWKRESKCEGDAPAKPKEPVAWRCLCDDTTIEALAALLHDQPRGLLVARDELAGWLGSMDRYIKGGKGADVSKWLEVFGGRSLMIDRKGGTPKTICIPRASVSITGGIQPGALQQSLTPDYFANGLAARLLFASPPRRAKQWTEADVTAKAEKAMEDLFGALYGLEPDVDESGEPRPAIVVLSPEAKQVWIEFFREHADEQLKVDGEMAAAFSKLEGYAARFALLVHCIGVATGALPFDAAADPQSIRDGVTLSRWFGREAKRVYAMLGEAPGDAQRRRLVEWIGGRGGRVTDRDVSRYNPRRYRTADDAHLALNELVKAGIGRWEAVPPGRRGGRPTRAFCLFDPAPADTTVEPSAEVEVVSAVGNVGTSADATGEQHDAPAEAITPPHTRTEAEVDERPIPLDDATQGAPSANDKMPVEIDRTKTAQNEQHIAWDKTGANSAPCPNHANRADWLDQPPADGRIRTTCRRCGAFIGTRPAA